MFGRESCGCVYSGEETKLLFVGSPKNVAGSRHKSIIIRPQATLTMAIVGADNCSSLLLFTKKCFHFNSKVAAQKRFYEIKYYGIG
jgi:hypothetical protein